VLAVGSAVAAWRNRASWRFGNGSRSAAANSSGDEDAV
jgi:hypothetical protein